jgi:hypothetical protein
MNSAVREDDDGVVFDSSHSSWKALLRAVEADTAAGNGNGTAISSPLPAAGVRPAGPAPIPPVVTRVPSHGVPRAPSTAPPTISTTPAVTPSAISHGGTSDDDREWVTLTPNNEPATDTDSGIPTPLTLTASALNMSVVTSLPVSPASPPVVSGMMTSRPDHHHLGGLRSAPATPLSATAQTPTSTTSQSSNDDRDEIDDEFLDENTARRGMLYYDSYVLDRVSRR